MTITDFNKMVMLLSDDEKEYLREKQQESLSVMKGICSDNSFESFLTAAYIISAEDWFSSSNTVLAYGAGAMARTFIPQMCSYLNISEVWDAYSSKEQILGIPICKPFEKQYDANTPVIVYIDNTEIRQSVISMIKEQGYKNIYYFRDFIELSEALSIVDKLKSQMTGDIRQIVSELLQKYEIICSDMKEVLFSIVPCNAKQIFLKIERTQNCMEELVKSFSTVLIFKNKTPEELHDIIEGFWESKMQNLYDFTIAFEKMLRALLSGGTKTKQRPIRMHGDEPYDKFAVFEAARILLEILYGKKYEEIVKILERFSGFSEKNISLIALKCYFLIKCGRYEEALCLSRLAILKAANDLFANEIFYQTAVVCRKNGLYVSEPIPEYDLNERFCWSGITFALCDGFEGEEHKPGFLPCFRTLQCGADPAGEFWSGEEWREFRKSLIDGSFKYCQKNNCPNLIGGWLPRKAECEHAIVKQMLQGDLEIVPPLEELHFSYDFHCNLQCPSCRLEIRTNSKEKNEELNLCYKKELLPLLKNAKHLCLSGCGEALLSPHSRAILKEMSPEQYPELSVELRTNVTSFYQRNWESLGEGRKVIKHIAASIDAATKTLFEKLRFPAKWDTVIKNLKYIQTLRNSKEIDLFEFHVVVQNENVEELIDIIKMAAKFDADVVTFSRLVNWRGMSEKEYNNINPFWHEHPLNERLKNVIREITELRDEIEAGSSTLIQGRRKLYINIHGVPDPDFGYEILRSGKLKIR